jgi:hypothetical protein
MVNNYNNSKKTSKPKLLRLSLERFKSKSPNLLRGTSNSASKMAIISSEIKSSTMIGAKMNKIKTIGPKITHTIIRAKMITHTKIGPKMIALTIIIGGTITIGIPRATLKKATNAIRLHLSRGSTTGLRTTKIRDPNPVTTIGKREILKSSTKTLIAESAAKTTTASKNLNLGEDITLTTMDTSARDPDTEQT